MSLGTPQLHESRAGDGRAGNRAPGDVYALGTVTYEMLIGEPPFTGPTAQAIVAKVMTTIPAAMIPQRRTIPSHVEAAVLHAIEKLPADRFATGAEFAAALGNPNFTGPMTAQSGRWGSVRQKPGWRTPSQRHSPGRSLCSPDCGPGPSPAPALSSRCDVTPSSCRGLEAISPLEQVTMAIESRRQAPGVCGRGSKRESRRSGFGIGTSSTRARSPRRGAHQPRLVTRRQPAGL